MCLAIISGYLRLTNRLQTTVYIMWTKSLIVKSLRYSCVFLGFKLAIFLHEGHHHNDHILLNGSRDWGMIPKGTIQDIDFDLPVRVLVGNRGFGYKHILGYPDRKIWMEGLADSVENFIHMKLGHSGDIFETDGRINQTRIKVAMRSAPSTLLIFEVIGSDSPDPYLSFVTAYQFNRTIREYKIGRYLWKFRADT